MKRFTNNEAQSLAFFMLFVGFVLGSIITIVIWRLVESGIL